MTYGERDPHYAYPDRQTARAYSQDELDAAVAAERERWKQAAEAMAQEADHKFTMEGTVAHWLRALVAKRGA